jgi:REP element-mobilizing transposase RayT
MAISITHAKRDRQNFDGATYHITSRCNNREFLFLNKTDFEEYLSILKKYKEKHKFTLYDYTPMSNHSHLLIELGETSNISKIMHSINRSFANWYNKEYNRTGHFWETRFYAELITDELQLLSTMVYLHLNPADWEYSGAQYYLKGIHNTLLTPPAIYNRLGADKQIRQITYSKILALYHDRIKNK